MANTELNFSNTIMPGDVIAVGDIHGKFEVFSKFLDWVKGTGARVILLGDLIDRGGEDMKVLNQVSNLLVDPEGFGLESFSVVRGNHEQMLIDAVEGDDQDVITWLYNGGNRLEFQEMVEKHLHWIKELPLFVRVADTLFVHAGLVPGKDPLQTIDEGQGSKLFWIRDPFLRKGPMLNQWTTTIKRVVHGHTIVDELPEVTTDRINLDTGAFYSGVLTTYNATRNTFQQFTENQ